MIKKISDKDKKDWENFLENKQKPPNKDILKEKDLSDKKIIDISDKDKKVISGDGEKIKTVYDTWVFSKDINSTNPNWLLIDTIT